MLPIQSNNYFIVSRCQKNIRPKRVGTATVFEAHQLQIQIGKMHFKTPVAYQVIPLEVAWLSLFL